MLEAQSTTTAGAAQHAQVTLEDLTRRHFRLGWVMLCVFVALGALLDFMHAFKSGVYLDVGTETRRFMWTLAHAHGLGLGLLHLAKGATLRAGMFAGASPRLRLGSACLVWAGVLIPTGFLLGGIAPQGADPSIGVFLVPAGGLVLLTGVFSTTAELFRS